MTEKLVAIVNSFNRVKLLEPGLTTLVRVLQSLPWRSRIIVFDAGSTDGSVAWIQNYARAQQTIPIHLIAGRLEEKVSFSAGVNRAWAFALEHYPGLESLLLFETDNWIRSSKPLLAADDLLQSENRLAAVGFTVVTHDGRPVGYGCPFPTPWQFIMGPQLAHRLKLDRPRPRRQTQLSQTTWWLCDAVYTSPLLIRRLAWEQANGLDEQTFPYTDCDIDWAWRLHKLGWEMAVIQTDEVVHDNRGELSAWSAQRLTRFHQARMALLRRHRGNQIDWAKPFLAARHAAELLLLAIWPVPSGKRREAMKTRRALFLKPFKNYE